MFVTAKPLAALSSGLLARKGQARPAMRPQAYAPLSSATPVDDLGWNDMGPEPAPPEAGAELPPVRVERAVLHDEVAQLAPDSEPATVNADAAAIASALAPRSAARGKAAFTLRLDHGRHLRLRLASAMTRRSSQALLTQALDSFLDTLPDVEELARQCSQLAPMGDAQ